MTVQRSRISPTVWALGLVSFFMDVSSEMIHALLPLFLTVHLGVSPTLLGLIEGASESANSIVKIVSGHLSDRVGRRKPFLLLGYGLAAVSKPFFALAQTPAVVFGARIADRIGKGVRGAPRDALIADVSRLSVRGRAYGLRQMLDTLGALAGPLLALALLAAFDGNIRLVFAAAVAPAVLSVACLVFGVREPSPQSPTRRAAALSLRDLTSFSGAFWLVLAIGVAFALARFSEAFLILRGVDLGLPVGAAPLVLVAMNASYAVGAYPAGALADRRRPAALLLFGLAALIAADLTLAWAPTRAAFFCGVVLWGAHMALTQGLLAKMVAEFAPERLRGSSFGLFNLAVGVAALASSVIAGFLWDALGPAATFLTGAGFCGLAATLILILAVASTRRG